MQAITCSCGQPFSFPAGTRELRCPHCGARFLLSNPPPSYPPSSYPPPKSELQQRIENYTSSSSPESRIMLAKFQEAQRKGYDYIVPMMGEDKIYQLFDTNAATEDKKERILGLLESSETNLRYRDEVNPLKKYKFSFGETIVAEPDVLLLKLVTLGGRRRKTQRRRKMNTKKNKTKHR